MYRVVDVGCLSNEQIRKLTDAPLLIKVYSRTSSSSSSTHCHDIVIEAPEDKLPLVKLSVAAFLSLLFTVGSARHSCYLVLFSLSRDCFLRVLRQWNGNIYTPANFFLVA